MRICRRIVLLVLVLAMDAGAQERLEVRASGGYEQIYLDEEPFLASGGSVHVRVRHGLLVGAEILQMDGKKGRSALIVTPLVTWEFRQAMRIQPYVSAGIGWSRLREPLCFPDVGTTSCTWGVYQSASAGLRGGIGLKIRLSNRLFVASEARLLGAIVNLGFRF